jgi:hypothetical protein
MIGYDRPLHPEWIQEVHRIWKPKMKISEFNEPFKEIAWQVDGVEAKRKARTNLVRYFVEFEGKGNGRTTKEYDLLVKLSQMYSLEDIRPLYLAIIFAQVEVVQTIIHYFAKRYDIGDEINVSKFIQFIKREYGDRDVIKRSVSSFFKSLYFFTVFENSEPNNYKNYFFRRKLKVSESLFPYLIFQIFVVGRGKLQIDANELLSEELLMFFDFDDLDSLINEYNNKFWVISKTIGSTSERLTFIQNEWSKL